MIRFFLFAIAIAFVVALALSWLIPYLDDLVTRYRNKVDKTEEKLEQKRREELEREEWKKL